jgi:hypothetical protein
MYVRVCLQFIRIMVLLLSRRKGKYIYREDDGTVYEGDWLRGIRHGKGKITFKDGR